MISELEKLFKFNPLTIILIVVLIINLIPQIIDTWNKFINALGYKTKSSVREEEKSKELSDLKKEFEKYKETNHDEQIQHYNQSKIIRKDILDKQNTLEEKQDDLKEDVKALTDMFQLYINMDNERTIAAFRTSLWKLHKDFVEQGFITPDGLKTFKEMGKIYVDAGGNDIFHEKLEPEVLALEIRYPNGSVYNK